MRISSLTILFALVIATTTSAQSEYGVNPGLWTVKVPPTTRSWGMGFAGAALVDESPAADNPASLGIWALTHDVLFGSNWSRGPAVPYGETAYDLSNLYQMVGARWKPAPFDTSAETLAIGLLYHRGRSRWGPYSPPSFFDDENGTTDELVTSNITEQSLAIGAAIDLGIELGFGFQWSRRELEMRDWPDLGGEYSPWACDCDDWKQSFGLIARGHASYILRRLLHRDSVLRLGSFTFDLTAAYGGGGNSSSQGWAGGGTLFYKNLPLIVFAWAEDREDVYSLSGREISLLGTYSYRWGNRRWRVNVLQDDGVRVPTSFRWPTHGHAFHSSGMSRWVQYLLRPEESSWTNWLLENVDVFYETAAFDAGDDAPPGLDELSIREWGFRLTGLIDLL